MLLYQQIDDLRAQFRQPEGRVTFQAPLGSSVDAAVTFPVEEGIQYYWDKANWASSHQFPSDDPNHSLGMRA